MTTTTVSSINKSTDYLFFENRDGFHFASKYTLSQKEPKYKLNNSFNQRLSGVYDRDVLLASNFVDHFDIVNCSDGIIGSTSYTHDLLNKKIIKNTLDYNTYRETVDSMNGGSIFVDDTFETNDNFKFIYGINDNVYVDHPDNNFLLNRQMEHKLGNLGTLEVTIAGNVDVLCGDTIVVNFQDALNKDRRTNVELDIFRSGKYMINSLCHEITPFEYYIHLELTKDSIMTTTKRLT